MFSTPVLPGGGIVQLSGPPGSFLGPCSFPKPMFQ